MTHSQIIVLQESLQEVKQLDKTWQLSSVVVSLNDMRQMPMLTAENRIKQGHEVLNITCKYFMFWKQW